ncbi:uncharacterized protein [Drosophila virilis]|uniref:uncharacterized protein n=1 Tax=Drosophila virilis TaxID=7244 RepID=UPI00017D4C68
MYKLSLTIALFGIFFCLGSAQTRVCPRKCELAFRCSPYYKDLVWSIVDGTCRVFQNGCLFSSENCNRVNSCKTKMEQTTREKCMKYCSDICPLGGSGLCASFAYTNADGTTGWKTRSFLNSCLLNRFACQQEMAYIGEPTEGECQV